MANAIYPKYKEALLSGNGPDLTTATVKFMLVDLADYTYATTHEFLSDVPGAAQVADGAALASKTVTDGTFDAADDPDAFPSATGDESEALILYVDTGVASTSRLLAYYDTGITNAPITPNGGDIGLTFNASGIFAL